MSSGKVAEFELAGVNFEVHTNDLFGDNLHQFKIDALSKTDRKTVEIFNIRNVKSAKHISPEIKKIAKVDTSDSDQTASDIVDEVVS